MRTLTTTVLVGLFKVKGVENVPRTGPLIVCPNHSGTLDPPMVPAFVPRNDTWSMAKSEYFHGGITEPLFRAYHAFPVVRHTPDRSALKFAFDLLKQDHVLIVFPEGTRVESGLLAEPEPGAGFIAQKRPDGTRVTHTEAAEAIMVEIAALLPERQRGVFADLESYRRRLAGVARPV